MLKINLLSYGKAHTGALVDNKLATKVGLFLVAFHEELLRAAIQFPINMTYGFACIVEAMFGKLNRKTVEGTLMQTSDESLHDLTCQEL